jgi:hypothetical protein
MTRVVSPMSEAGRVLNRVAQLQQAHGLWTDEAA